MQLTCTLVLQVRTIDQVLVNVLINELLTISLCRLRYYSLLLSPSTVKQGEKKGDAVSGVDPADSLLRLPPRRRSEEGISWIGVRRRVAFSLGRLLVG